MDNQCSSFLVPQRVCLEGSFLVNGTSDPDGIRDFNTNLIDTVVRTSAGLFTVTLADYARPWIPAQINGKAFIMPVDATPVLVCACQVVEGSWSPVTRSFQILTTVVADTGASAYFDPAPGDPDDNSRICFEIVGSISPTGQDAA